MDNMFVAGRRVKVKNDLTKTYAEYGSGSGGTMERMKDRIFVIDYASGYRIKLYSKEANFKFTFHPDDLILIDDADIKITYPAPEMFNPKQLDI